MIDHENPWAAVIGESRPLARTWCSRPWPRQRGSSTTPSVGRTRLARSAEFFDFLIEDVNGLTETLGSLLSRTHR